MGCLPQAVGAFALRADNLLLGSAGGFARGAEHPVRRVGGSGGRHVTYRPSAPQGGGLVFPGKRHLPAAVCTLHRVLFHHGLRPVQLLPDGPLGGHRHRAGSTLGHLGQDATCDDESGPDLRGMGHVPGQPSRPPATMGGAPPLQSVPSCRDSPGPLSGVESWLKLVSSFPGPSRESPAARRT